MIKRDQVTIIEPNGIRRTLALTDGMIIGRGSDSSIIIDYDLTSRYHAQITFDGRNYYVTDLGSTNGSYLGKVKLPPNTPQVWMPGTPLRIGKVIFQLEQVQPPPKVDQDAMETRLGWLPEEDQSAGSRRRMLFLLLIGLAVLGLCAMGIAAYFLF